MDGARGLKSGYQSGTCRALQPRVGGPRNTAGDAGASGYRRAVRVKSTPLRRKKKAPIANTRKRGRLARSRDRLQSSGTDDRTIRSAPTTDSAGSRGTGLRQGEREICCTVSFDGTGTAISASTSFIPLRRTYTDRFHSPSRLRKAPSAAKASSPRSVRSRRACHMSPDS